MEGYDQTLSDFYGREANSQLKKLPASSYDRVTKLPVKPGSIPDIVAAIEPIRQEVKAYEGELNIEMFSGGDDVLVIHSSWSSAEYLAASQEKLMAVIGIVKPFVTGPPQMNSGPVVWRFEGGAVAASDMEVHCRTMAIPIKPGAMSKMFPMPPSIVELMKDLEGNIGICTIDAGEKMVVVSHYTSAEHLEASAPKVKGILSPMMEHFAGPPDGVTGPRVMYVSPSSA